MTVLTQPVRCRPAISLPPSFMDVLRLWWCARQEHKRTMKEMLRLGRTSPHLLTDIGMDPDEVRAGSEGGPGDGQRL